MIESEIQRYLDELVEEDRFSGTVLLAREGIPVFQQAYGYAHQGYKIPNQLNTKYNIGSATKMFTALAIVQLAAQQKLDFGDLVGKYLAGFDKQIADTVTIHHLLTHISGMAGSILNEATFQANKHLVRTTNDWLAFVLNTPLQFEPGSSWSYSNAGFLVLGAIIEAVTRQEYFEYVRDHIWLPASMNDSDASPLDVEVANRALGYMNREDGEPIHLPRRNNIPYSLIRGSAHGGSGPLQKTN